MLSSQRQASHAIREAVRTLAEPRVSTAFTFYRAGAVLPSPLAEGTPDLLLTASLGNLSAGLFADLTDMGLCGGDL
jgi:hypothetical protein